MTLVGVMGMFQSTLLHKIVQVMFSIGMACSICLHMPLGSKLFNYANVISQLIITVNFLATIVLSSRSGEVIVGITPEHVELVLISGQQLMVLYLLYVIFGKMRRDAAAAKVEVADEMLMHEQLQGKGNTTTSAAENAIIEATIKRAFEFFDVRETSYQSSKQ